MRISKVDRNQNSPLVTHVLKQTTHVELKKIKKMIFKNHRITCQSYPFMRPTNPLYKMLSNAQLINKNYQK